MKKRIIIGLVCVVIFLGVLGLLLGFRKDNDKSLTKVKLAEVTHSSFYSPLYVALEKGYFKENGIDLELILTPGADKVSAAVLSGDVEIGFAGAESAIYVYKQDESDYLTLFAGLTKRDGQFIVSRKKIKDFKLEDLYNKEILVGRSTGMPALNFLNALKKNNIDTDKINVNTAVEFSALSGSFIGGVGDFVNLFEPNATALVKQGYGNVVASVGMLSGEVPYTAFYARKSYIKDNEIKADEMFITGDFRNAAIECSDEQTLVDKTIKFIEDIANSVGVTDRTHIHIVPGNHDLERCTLNPDLDEIRNSYNCCEGAFPPEVYKQLISRFGFYTHIYNNLYSENDPITLGNLPLHLSKCYKDYALVYLNTAISCGNDNDRGALVIGNIELYEQLEYIKSQNPTLPIIVLAHHSPELFNPEEKDVIQNIFLDYNVLLYLCGDAHKISCRKINDVLEYTTGCMTYQSDVHITFACGELLNNNHEIKSYFWDSHTLQWGIYDQFNQHYKRISKKWWNNIRRIWRIKK